MTPETEEQLQERRMNEVLCGLVGHKYETIEMPEDWKIMSGSISCKFCTYSAPIEINRVKDDEAEALEVRSRDE